MKALVLIDGANTDHGVKSIGCQLDWSAVRQSHHEQYDHVRLNYYSASLADKEGYNKLYPLYEWLAFNGFSLVQKKSSVYEEGGETKIKGNMDVEIAVDMVQATTWADELILFSGDNDFTYAVQQAQQKGAKVTVISTRHRMITEEKVTEVVKNFLDKPSRAFVIGGVLPADVAIEVTREVTQVERLIFDRMRSVAGERLIQQADTFVDFIQMKHWWSRTHIDKMQKLLNSLPGRSRG